MASGYGKKSLKGKFNAAVKKGAAVMALTAAALTPGWYYYGTVHEQDVKITSIEKVEVKKPDSTAQNHSASNGTSYFSNNNNPYRNSSYSSYSDVYGSYDDMNVLSDAEIMGNDPFYYSSTSSVPPSGTYEYIIHTDGGVFKNKDTYSHLKFDSEDIEKKLAVGQTYHIKSYGISFSFPWKVLDFSPNILTADLLTEKDLQARAEALAAEKAKDADAALVAGQQGKDGSAITLPAGDVVPQNQQQQTLSGEVVTYPVIVGGYSVQLTIPVEAVGKITVNTVRPVVIQSPKLK